MVADEVAGHRLVTVADRLVERRRSPRHPPHALGLLDGHAGPDREREIIRLRFGLADGYAYTLEEVGSIFDVTRERVRQIEAKAVEKLREPGLEVDLAGFVDDGLVERARAAALIRAERTARLRVAEPAEPELAGSSS